MPTSSPRPRRRVGALGLLVVLCALPVMIGARRLPGGAGCGGTLMGRSLTVVNGGVESESFIDDDTRNITLAESDELFGLAGWDRVRWRADGNSYIDVFFDEDFTVTTPTEFATFVRYEWPDADFGGAREENPLATFLAIGDQRLFQYTTRPVTIRYYDRGACSRDVRWRDLANAVMQLVDNRVHQFFSETGGDSHCGARPSGNWAVTPRLTEELFGVSRDRFTFGHGYTLLECSGTTVTGPGITVEGRFRASELELRYSVTGAVVAEDGLPAWRPDGWDHVALQNALRRDLAAAINPRFRDELLAEVFAIDPTNVNSDPTFPCNPGPLGDAACLTDFRDSFPSDFPPTASADIVARNAICVADPPNTRGAGCGLVPNVHRVYERPEGIEYVISEWSRAEEIDGRGDADPLFRVFDALGACDRVTLPPTPTAGYMGVVFDLPPPGPQPYGNDPI